MKNHFFRTALFSCACSLLCCFALQAGEVIPYTEALEKAKQEKKSIVVVSDGSDWLPCSPALNESYKALANKATTWDDKVIWALHDEKNAKPEGDAAPKVQRPPMKVWNYPAVQVLDSEGRPLYFKEFLKPEELISFEKELTEVEEILTKRDAYWAKAAQEKGAPAIENLAKGLDLMDEKVVRQGSYKDQIERIKAEDPSDKKGYYLRFTYNFLPFMEGEIDKRVQEKKFAEAYKIVDDKLKLPMLTTYQRQSITAAKFHIAREQGNLSAALGCLKQVAAIDPKSEFGKGAINLAIFYTQPVKLEGLQWTNTDNRPVWLPMVVDVSSVVKGAGKYKVEFKHKRGHTKFRNPSFKSASGKDLVAIKDDKEERVFTLTLPSSSSKTILEVESQGTGWFDGRGDIIITKE